ncbi:molybdate ABC transporter permease subunit [Metabacillus litoralis]|uniref:molybdate ABC transporter permease subunit n=1 Tax=Metabacillus TaxID=2675233 RepID=UPI000EF5B43D|nr:molybdate ABC transporter permease subunit [Metabacillus litoralis]MCM3160271.1 molybdate ABC transporter permease subunit [Metabacillus litoralis]MCM3408855.1 molybdate ABC transporter permease subunit [Metabacillus litoralis]UHA59494.1 molybdate ABC transporter permease subunit [Metabacillus litoralis]
MTYEFWDPIFLSVRIALIASVFVLLMGTLIGRFMAKSSFKGKMLVETVLILPLVLPPSVIGFFLIIIFGMNSPIGQVIENIFNETIIFTWWAGVVAAAVVAFPLMYQVTKAGFEHVDTDIENAARVDGADEGGVFFLVSLPLTIKYIFTGFVLSFTRALGEFGATLMFAGNIPGKTQTVSTAIYVAIDSGKMDLAWLWVLSMILISSVMLLIVQWMNKKAH